MYASARMLGGTCPAPALVPADCPIVSLLSAVADLVNTKAARATASSTSTWEIAMRAAARASVEGDVRFQHDTRERRMASARCGGAAADYRLGTMDSRGLRQRNPHSTRSQPVMQLRGRSRPGRQTCRIRELLEDGAAAELDEYVPCTRKEQYQNFGVAQERNVCRTLPTYCHLSPAPVNLAGLRHRTFYRLLKEHIWSDELFRHVLLSWRA
jgi:hypothetical protein